MVLIRRSTPADIPVLVDFQLLLAAETENMKLDKEVVTRGVQALFEDTSKGLYYVAEYRSELIGCCLITYEWSDWRNGMIWWLQSVYVKTAYRKRGVFRSMHRYLTDVIAQDPSVSGLRLYVDKTNIHAQHVYKTLGMNGDHYTVFEQMKK